MTRQLVAAMSGWGKSYLTQSMSEDNVPEFDHVLLLDYCDDYQGLCLLPALSRFIAGPVEVGFGSSDWRAIIEEYGSLQLPRYRLDNEQWRTVIASVIRAARRMAREDDVTILIVIDEAHFVAPQSGKLRDEIKGLATTGRGEGVASLWVTQRLTELDETIIGQVDVKLAGGYTSERDREKLNPEYPEDVHNPELTSNLSPSNVPDALAVDGEFPPLRKWTDDEGNPVGSEWVYSDTEGRIERLSTKNIEMSVPHVGQAGTTIKQPV